MTFDAKTERVVARRRVRIEDLILEDRETPLPENGEVARLLMEMASERFDSVRPPEDSPPSYFLGTTAMSAPVDARGQFAGF